MKRCFVSLILSLVVLVAFVERAMLQEREVTLRFKFQPNQIRTYEIHWNGEMNTTIQLLGQEVPSITMSMEGKMTQTEHIVSLDKEGIATLVITSKGRMKMETFGLPAGTEGKIPSEQEIPTTQLRLKVNSLGKVTEMQMKQISEPNQQGKVLGTSQFTTNLVLPQMQGGLWQGLSLPEKPIRIGDSWDITTTMEVSTAERTAKVEVKGRARLVSFEKLEGRECAVIEAETEIPDIGEIIRVVPLPTGDAQAEGRNESKIWFDINDGLIIRNETKTQVTINLTISAPTGESINMSMQGVFRHSHRLTKVAQSKPEGQ